MLSPTSPIHEIGRLGPLQKKGLARIGINTIRDLLYYFPSRYSDISTIKLVKDLEHGETATIYGHIQNPQTKKSFRSKMPMAEATLIDVTGTHIKVVWFNQAYIAKMLTHEAPVQLTGKVSLGKAGYSMTNPEIEKLEHLPIDRHESLFKNNETQDAQFGYPIYRETRGITSKWLYHAVKRALTAEILEQLTDPIPEEILKRYNLPTLQTALVWVHMPQSKSDADAARKRFAFEEIFFIQLAKQQERTRNTKRASHTISVTPELLSDFIDQFPFTPTDAQARAVETIVSDLGKPNPMSRLLEGDVGSGKTFVAAAIAYATISTPPADNKAGHLQVAYMAPTEVLAAQLFESFIEYFRGHNIQIGLITGSGCRKFPSKVDPGGWTKISRAQLLKWVANGEIPILVGTHALIQKSVNFKHLGMAIIDEQHRFGTKQRAQLVGKSDVVPHFLSMTATPIPRTLALTIYGDLDLSVLDQVPSGRKKVITEIVHASKREGVYDAIKAEIEAGRQAYVICPRIDTPDDIENMSEEERAQMSVQKLRSMQLKSVKQEAKRLSENVFKDYRIDIMHSKMKKDEKEEVMKRFSDHDIDVLVSTSVVEVGVNVPNATVIIIEGAERFGLSQLHQLRGRVQRSSHQPYCYLFTSESSTRSKKTIERLKAMKTAKNGFELAEIDLAQRGAGDLAGQKQWGLSDLGMEAIKNIKMVEAARTEATALVENDPDLASQPLLAEVLENQKVIHFE